MHSGEVEEGWVRKYATAATAGLFLVSGLTGLMLFFHVGGGSFKAAHEWLSVAFVIAAFFHVIRNRRAFGRLVTRPAVIVVCGMVLAAFALILAASPGDDGYRRHGRPARAALELTVPAAVEVLPAPRTAEL